MSSIQLDHEPPAAGSEREKPAPSGCTAQSLPGQFRRILVPLDFSESSTKALKYAAAFATQFNATLSLIYVVEPAFDGTVFGPGPVSLPDSRGMDAAREKLADVAAAWVPPCTPVYPHVETGLPWKCIVDSAAAQHADLIIIATHGYTGLKHALLGSTAERVVQHATCPVLVVRQREQDFIQHNCHSHE